MFTVKHRESPERGEGETLYSADKIEVVWPGPARNVAGTAAEGASNIYEAGIFLDPEPPQGFEPGDANEGQVVRMAKNVILFGHDSTADGQARKGGKVWVMNEQGSTVATYDL